MPTPTRSLLLAIALVGCSGEIGSPSNTPPGVGPGGPDTSRPIVEIRTCAPDEFTAGTNPARRLTNEQYRRSLAVVFPGLELPSLGLVEPIPDHTYVNDVANASITELVVESYQLAARNVAQAAVASPGWMPCGLTTAECAVEVAIQSAERAFRRPLVDEELTRFESFITTQAAEADPTEAVTMFLEALLQMPDYLYLPEIGDPRGDAPRGMVALHGYELAARLSYFLWNEPPDAELIAAAESGDLGTESGYEAQLERLLASDQTKQVVDDFFSQWLQQEQLELARASEFPELDDDELRAELQASYRAYVRHAFWEEGDIDYLFSSRDAFVNDRLAPYFGVDAPGSDTLVPVELPEAERSGILTQPSVLASTSHGAAHSPIFRGVLVLRRVLCAPLSFPDEALEPPEVDSEPRTTRERLEEQHTSGTCGVCHDAIDGIGFAFERYDAVGRYRETEYGQPVDSSGSVSGLDFTDAIGLVDALEGDLRVEQCLSTHFFRYALSRNTEIDDQCHIAEVASALAEDGDLRGALRAVASSDAFRFAPAE
ncbi:MAG: DUF1592 domain-containing protein [Deltaproteobacteria bacterium]|nr:DUF1592 domain-containing protein [Deltaproteobacteria bacterium]